MTIRDGSTHIRPPTDYDAEHMLLRTVRCVDGQAQLTLDCVPAFDYGRQHARWRHTDRGYTQAVIEPEGLDLTLTLTSDIRLGLEGPGARARTLLKEGDTRFCALSWGRPRRRRTTRTPTGGWCGPRTTGSTGWPAAASPTTAGAATWPAARSPSRA